MSKEVLKPIFNKNAVAVVFSVTDNYVPVFGTCLQSLISNSSAKNNYDIFVLTENISENNQKRLINMCPQNFSLRFVDVTSFFEKYSKVNFYLSEHITIAAYYRFFIPELFSSFRKVIYSDSDLVFLGDIAELYKTDLHGHIIGAVLSGWPFAMNNQFEKYAKEKLKMKDPYLYIQDGILLCDISKMKKTDFTKGCIQRLQEIKTPRTWDQCIINSLCYGDIQLLDRKWNMEWHYPFCHPQYEEKVAKGIYDEYLKARNNPKIIHYASATKPWNAPERDLAFYFWKYARICPFYEELLQNLIYSHLPQNNIINILRDALKINALKWKYIKYKLLSKLTLGEKKIYYKNKKQQNKQKLKRVKEFFKEI